MSFSEDKTFLNQNLIVKKVAVYQISFGEKWLL